MATTKKEETAEVKKEETVKIRLWKDDGDYKDDVHVIINGKAWVIQRGVDVEVPVCVAEVLQHSEEQRNSAFRMQDKFASDFENASKNV